MQQMPRLGQQSLVFGVDRLFDVAAECMQQAGDRVQLDYIGTEMVARQYPLDKLRHVCQVRRDGERDCRSAVQPPTAPQRLRPVGPVDSHVRHKPYSDFVGRGEGTDPVRFYLLFVPTQTIEESG